MSTGSTSPRCRIGVAIAGVPASLAIGVYAIRPDLVPGAFHGLDLLLVLAGWLTVQLVRSRGLGRASTHAVAVVVTIAAMATVAVAVWVRGPNRMHDVLGILGVLTGTLDVALQSGFEAPGSYATIVQGMWVVAVIAQLALAAVLLLALTQRADRPVRAGVRLSALAVVVSFAYAATPGVYLPFNGYFAFASRAWEFAAGCVLAFAMSGVVDASRRAGAVLSAAGLLGFVATTFLVGPAATTNVSWSALPTVVCAVLVLAGATLLSRAAQEIDSSAVRALSSTVLPLVLTSGAVVGALAYVFPPIWVPGSNPARDVVAVVAWVLSGVLALLIARAAEAVLGRIRIRIRAISLRVLSGGALRRGPRPPAYTRSEGAR